MDIKLYKPRNDVYTIREKFHHHVVDLEEDAWLLPPNWFFVMDEDNHYTGYGNPVRWAIVSAGHSTKKFPFTYKGERGKAYYVYAYDFWSSEARMVKMIFEPDWVRDLPCISVDELGRSFALDIPQPITLRSYDLRYAPVVGAPHELNYQQKICGVPESMFEEACKEAGFDWHPSWKDQGNNN